MFLLQIETAQNRFTLAGNRKTRLNHHIQETSVNSGMAWVGRESVELVESRDFSPHNMCMNSVQHTYSERRKLYANIHTCLCVSHIGELSLVSFARGELCTVGKATDIPDLCSEGRGLQNLATFLPSGIVVCGTHCTYIYRPGF